LGKLSLHHTQRTLELRQRKNPIATNNGEVGPSLCLDKQRFQDFFGLKPKNDRNFFDCGSIAGLNLLFMGG
jgi:hypothetical protein